MSRRVVPGPRRAGGDDAEADPDDEAASPVDAVVGELSERAEEVRRRELDTALSKLEHRGEVGEERREAVAALAAAIVSEVLAGPTATLREAAESGDRETVATAADLFDVVSGASDGAVGTARRFDGASEAARTSESESGD